MVFVNGCGYAPSAKFAREVLGEKVSTSVVVSSQDPENTVIIKDALDSAIIEVFQASLVSKAESSTHLIVSIGSASYVPIVYDKNGYVTGYRMNLVLNIKSFKNGESKEYNLNGFYDFAIVANALVTDQERFDAIRFSAQKAIRSFIAKVSADGARANKTKEQETK